MKHVAKGLRHWFSSDSDSLSLSPPLQSLGFPGRLGPVPPSPQPQLGWKHLGNTFDRIWDLFQSSSRTWLTLLSVSDKSAGYGNSVFRHFWSFTHKHVSSVCCSGPVLGLGPTGGRDPALKKLSVWRQQV